MITIFECFLFYVYVVCHFDLFSGFIDAPEPIQIIVPYGLLVYNQQFNIVVSVFNFLDERLLLQYTPQGLWMINHHFNVYWFVETQKLF